MQVFVFDEYALACVTYKYTWKCFLFSMNLQYILLMNINTETFLPKT